MENQLKVHKQMHKTKTRPKYEPPKVITYQEDEILKQMGPIGGCVSPDYDPLAGSYMIPKDNDLNERLV